MKIRGRFSDSPGTVLENRFMKKRFSENRPGEFYL